MEEDKKIVFVSKTQFSLKHKKYDEIVEEIKVESDDEDEKFIEDTDS